VSPSVPDRYAVLVPVKRPAVAKSRLAPLGDQARRDLAAAFAADTVLAVLSCDVVDRVLVVTDDHVLARTMTDLGADVIPDGTSDLNGTLVQAAAEMHRRDPGLRLAAVCADLPALRAAELGSALRASAAAGMSFVADREGIGTTTVTASDLASFRPSFGHGSRRHHLDAGAHEVDGVDVPSVRRDVDDPAELDEALALGVGPRTALVATTLRLPGSTRRVLETVQATVATYDATNRSGTVLLDDGRRVAFGAGALAGSVRLLRPGQRVRIDTDVDATVVRVQLVTLP
jgi:2-phospho-L-lactate guanylyltransferase